MFAYEIRQAIEAAPRIRLPEVAALMWRAYADGNVSEAEAEALSVLIEAQLSKNVQQAGQKPNPTGISEPEPLASLQKCIGASRILAGSRPRTDASMERRRRWAASGRMPPAIAAKFTAGETAALAVVAMEAQRTGSCRWPLARIAAVGGVSVSTVKRAVRQARALGMVKVEVRRVAMWRNLPSITTITDRAWLAWLSRGGGVQPWTRSNTKDLHKSVEPVRSGAKGHRRQRDGRIVRPEGAGMRPPASTAPPTPSERPM